MSACDSCDDGDDCDGDSGDDGDSGELVTLSPAVDASFVSFDGHVIPRIELRTGGTAGLFGGGACVE